jgi:hypothetical protein
MKTTPYGLGGRVRKPRHVWPAIVLLAFVIECTCAYADDAKPNIVFIDGTALTLSPDSYDAFKFDIPVTNSGGKEGEASLKLLSGTDKGCDQAKMNPKAKRLSPNAVAITQFEITNVELPATCYIELVTEGERGNTSLKKIKFTQQYVTSTVSTFLFGCFCFSGLVAVFTWVVAGLRFGEMYPNFPIGPPGWDFTKSWTSNTTLVGAIILTALTQSALPELTKYASKSGYSALALLISFAIIIAPFLFIVLSIRGIEKDPKTGKDAVVYQGYLLPFLLSCAITLFAGLAQLVVFFLLLDEVFNEYGFWSFSGTRWLNAGSILTVVLGVALCWYAGNSMFLTINLQVAAHRAKGRLPPWPVL